jgi:hypothetical protein
MSEQGKIATICRFCEFNQKDEYGNQIGCELNLIERYEKKNINVENYEFEDEHGKGTCKKIETFCLFRRPPGWKKAKEPLLKDQETYESIARSELVIDVTFLVYIPEGRTMDDVFNFMEYMHSMDTKPNKIIFMNCAKISPLKFIDLNNKTDLDWSMEFMLKLNDSVDEIRKRANDLGSKKVQTTFFLTLDLDHRIDQRYLTIIRQKILDDLDSISLILDDQDKPNFYQTVIYKHVRGNEQADVNEKIRWITEDQKCQHIIKTPTEIFNSQK